VVEEAEYPERTTDHGQATGKLLSLAAASRVHPSGVVVGVKVQGVEVVVQAEANLGVLVKTAKNILNHDQNHQRRMVIRIEYQIIVETVVFNFNSCSYF
jgi:hypothetical protein